MNLKMAEKLKLNAAQSFHVVRRASVSVGMNVSEWFTVNVGLRQGCAMSPRLFDIYMSSLIFCERLILYRVLGKRLEVLHENGSRFEINHYGEGG